MRKRIPTQQIRNLLGDHLSTLLTISLRFDRHFSVVPDFSQNMTIICRNISGKFVLSISKHLILQQSIGLTYPSILLHEIFSRERERKEKEGIFYFTLKVVVQKLAELVVLPRQVGEVDEEPGAHVALHGLDLLWPRRPVVLHQEVAILEKTAASNFLWTLRRYQLLVKM